nr:MAG TPA: hypothetical protein [Caudoviricetes sp.]
MHNIKSVELTGFLFVQTLKTLKAKVISPLRT